MTAAPRLIMWNGCVRALSFADQLVATARAGFDELSVTPADWARWVSDGLSSADLRAMAADAGVDLTHLDPIARWYEPWQPRNLDPVSYPLGFFGFDVDDFLRIAEAIGARSFTAIATAPAGAVGLDVLTERYADLCRRAADVGLVCELEFIPLGWAVPDLATAWRIVRDADRPNSGIVVDTWHLARSGTSLDELRAVPPERITSVQLCDADLEIPAGRDATDDCLRFRRPVGEGDLPVAQVVAALAEMGALTRVGPEYFSDELDRLDAATIGSVCGRTVAAALAPHL